MSKAEIGVVAMAKGVSEFRKALIRVAEQIGKAWNRIPPHVRESLYFAAREQRSIDRYKARHEEERQKGLAYVRELGIQARRDLGLPLDDRDELLRIIAKGPDRATEEEHAKVAEFAKSEGFDVEGQR